MTTWLPDITSSQFMKIRVRPLYREALPLSCSILYSSEDRWTSGSVTASVAHYESNGFLNLSASISIPYGEFYTVEVFQTSGSNTTYNKLYQGEIYATTQSAILTTSEPFESYTSQSTEYILF